MAHNETPMVVVAGTFAPRRGAARYYAPMLAGRRAEVLALRHLGMANTRDSAHDVDAWCGERYDEPVTLVGHSQGALVAAWLWLHRPERYRPPVLLAGPWAGAPGCQTWSPVGGALRAMSKDSRFLREMSESFGALREDEKADLTVICAAGDRLVSPDKAIVPGATNVCVAPAGQHERLARAHPDAVLVDGSMNHSSIPRNPLVHRLLDAHAVGAGPAVRAAALTPQVEPLPVRPGMVPVPALAAS